MKTLVAALAAMVILLPSMAISQECRLLQRADELKLTEQQIEQLQAAALANKKEMIQPRADLEKAKLELNEMMMAKNIDRKKALDKQKQISAIKGQIAEKRLAAKIDRLNILNDEQRARVRKDMMLRGPRHHGRDRGFRMRDCCPGPGMKGDRIEKRIMRRFGDVGDEKIIIMDEDIEIDEDN